MISFRGITLTLLSMLVVLAGSCSPAPTEKANAATSGTPSIEGTYKLVSRELPDGSVLKSPKVIGLFTYTKTHRNFSVVTEDAKGKTFYSFVATYKLTPTEYSQTQLFSVANDDSDRNKIIYDMAETTQSAPVKTEGGRIEFKLPGNEPVLTFEGTKLTATSKDEFVDVWEKVQ